MSVTTKAKLIANLEDAGVQTKLTSVLPLAAVEMRRRLGDTQYDAYMGLSADGNDDPSDPGFVAYDSLDADGKTKRDLEFAEAHFACYFLVPALKRLREDEVLYEEEGKDNSLKASEIKELERARAIYLEYAEKIIGDYLDSVADADEDSLGAGGADVRIYAI